MLDHPEVEDVQEQLELYGSWLRSRTEVGLSNDLAEPAVAAPSQPQTDRPSRTRVALAVAGVAAVAGGAGLVFAVGGGSGDDSVTVAGQSDTADDADAAADIGDGDESATDALDVELEDDADVAETADDQERDMTSDSSSSFSAPAEGSDSDPATDSNEQEDSVPSTTIEQPTPTTEPEPEESATAETAAPTGGSMRFISPGNGATVDMNLGVEFRANPMDGASSYVFTVTQNGNVVISQTVSEPLLFMPSRLTSFTDGPQYEAGAMTVSVRALDAAGTEIGSGSIQIVMRSGGGAPRLGP